MPNDGDSTVRVLHWCNGGHYHRGDCFRDWSPTDEELAAVAATVAELTYDVLIEAGEPEERLLAILLVDEEAFEAIGRVRCSEPAGARCARAVVERNRLLLDRFPSGELHRQLFSPPKYAKHLYARHRSSRDSWVRVGATFDPESRKVLAALRGARVPATAALSDERDWEVRALLVHDEHPPVSIADDLLDDVGEQIRARYYPLIPAGHLLFQHSR